MRILAVANQKGGVGKTTVTMQLGAVLSRRFRVLVVDIDPQRSTVWWAQNTATLLPFDFAGNQPVSVLAGIRELHAEYDFVIVDTPGSLEDTKILEAVLDVADFVLVPLTPEALALEPTIRTIDRLIEPRGLRHAVVLNRIDTRVPGQLPRWQAMLDSTYGVPRLASSLRQFAALTEAPVRGTLVTTMPDNRRTAGAIVDVIRLGYEVSEQFTPQLAGTGW